MSKDRLSAKKEVQTTKNFVFSKENYLLMIASVAIVFIGFALMVGSEDIFDFRKLTLAPIVVLVGFVVGIFAIMRKSK
ncbi:MAG: DUF3098 domain-containing protein [Bacteroidia bacterium]|nr:DUF3098 domain-containing protein [Bacteroidia bacterium]